MPSTGTVRLAAASARVVRTSSGEAAALQAGDASGQRPLVAGQDGLDRGRVGGQVEVALPDQLVDHARQAEALAVLGREDPRTPASASRSISVGDDDPAATAVDLDVAGPGLGQQLAPGT